MSKVHKFWVISGLKINWNLYFKNPLFLPMLRIVNSHYFDLQNVAFVSYFKGAQPGISTRRTLYGFSYVKWSNQPKIHQNHQLHHADFALTNLTNLTMNIHLVWQNFIKSVTFVIACIFGHKCRWFNCLQGGVKFKPQSGLISKKSIRILKP